MSDFRQILTATLSAVNIQVDGVAIDRLCRYHDLLIEWNERMNLTALTEPRDVALKHFADCLTLLRYIEIPDGAAVIDVGTGAGFPGLVLKIARPDIRLTLLDSLQKRLTFLDAVCIELGLDRVQTVHSRAEDGARTALRESYDLAVSRAVAPLATLSEYCLPYVHEGGRFVAMKGKGGPEELQGAQRAIQLLGGAVETEHHFALADAGERYILAIRKVAATPAQYPRKSKLIKNKPL